MIFSLQIDGARWDVSGASDASLAEILYSNDRSKIGESLCADGSCGACTVLIDGQPSLSCLTLASLCEGKDVVTPDCFTSDPSLSALRNLLLARKDDARCGICAGGFVASAAALLSANPRPTREHVRHALSGNVCRCIGYSAIIDAVLGLDPDVALGSAVQLSFGLPDQSGFLEHQQTRDQSARAGNLDPMVALRSGVTDSATLSLLDQAASKFGWASRWDGWHSADASRLARGLGASFQTTRPDQPGLALVCLVELEFDRETGVVSLGSMLATAGGPGLREADARVVEAGVIQSIFEAFVEKQPSEADRSSDERFPAGFPTAIDVVDLTCVAFSSGGMIRPLMTVLKDAAASAMVCAIASGIFHGTGRVAPSLPFTAIKLINSS